MEQQIIPEGYKQTEIGVIPDDWVFETLGKIGDVRMCKRIFSTQTSITRDIPFFKIGTFGRKPDAYISYELYSDFKSKYSYPQKGDILLSAAGTLGRTVIYDGEYAYFQDSNIVWLELNKDKICNEYLYHYYQIIKWASPEGTTIARLYNSVIRSTFVIFPPTRTEQTTIANALSDVDALITSIEKLIGKKQAIKTATMQQLLTGKKRLPPFDKHPDGTPKAYKQTELGEIPEDWEVVNFGKLFEESVTRKKIRLDSQVSFVGMQDVSEDAQLVSPSALVYKKVKSGFTYFERNDVLVAKITPCFENGKGCFTDNLPTMIGFGSTEFHVLRAIPNASAKYIYYITVTNRFRNELESEMVGSAGHRRVPFSALKDYQIPATNDKEEQIAIANIFSDMDAEIQGLNQRLTKTQQIKQGMMQELLTGKTRLPINTGCKN